MAYAWKFYLLVAHLVDDKNHTACNRQLSHVDDAAGEVPEKSKCSTCKLYALKFRGTEQ
jgi:hypothetical protein